ncbi:MAG: CBS domain-containing protein [Actinomycetota bacterium]|nr:CBS domain-containing protein [Actinomycetota bacterium]
MEVASILSAKGRQVETIGPDADVRLVLHKLATLGIGSVVVSTDGRRVEGMVSERDVVVGLNRHGQQFLELRARDVMSRKVPTCAATDTLAQVMALMTRTRRRHLPVVDAEGFLCGIVSIGDVVKHRLGEIELERDVLRDAYVARR